MPAEDLAAGATTMGTLLTRPSRPPGPVRERWITADPRPEKPTPVPGTSADDPAPPIPPRRAFSARAFASRADERMPIVLKGTIREGRPH